MIRRPPRSTPFPTRRSSDLLKQYELETNLIAWVLVDASQSMAYRSGPVSKYDYACMAAASLAYLIVQQIDSVGLAVLDRKSTRLNSSHSQISYAVFCLEKKT